MPRVKRGTVRRAKRKKLLARAKGFYQTKSKLYRAAKESVDTALKYAFVGRRRKKRDFRRLWVVRINAAARENGLTYGAVHRRAQGRRHHARSQEPRRPRRARRRPRSRKLVAKWPPRPQPASRSSRPQARQVSAAIEASRCRRSHCLTPAPLRTAHRCLIARHHVRPDRHRSARSSPPISPPPATDAELQGAPRPVPRPQGRRSSPALLKDARPPRRPTSGPRSARGANELKQRDRSRARRARAGAGRVAPSGRRRRRHAARPRPLLGHRHPLTQLRERDRGHLRCAWATRSSKAPSSRTTTTTSKRSTCRRSIPRATCRTRSTWRRRSAARGGGRRRRRCCARTRRRCRSATWRRTRRRCASSRPAASTAATTST